MVLLCGYMNSQIPSLSGYEKCWALWHPFAALKVKKITRACYHFYNPDSLRSVLDPYENGGKTDAYRHLFFMAAYAQEIAPRKLRKLGIMHEKANHRQFIKGGYEEGERPDSVGSVMDLRNNDKGLLIGRAHKNMPLAQLSQLVIKEIRNGNGWIIKRKRSGEYTDCNDIPLFIPDYKDKCQIPKCLVPSDASYND
jgi:hypothetical protein